MTTTTSSLNKGLSTTPIATTVEALDVTKFALVDTKILPDGFGRESVYQLMSGNDEYPMTVRIGVYKNAKANGGVGSTNVSVKVLNSAQKVDVDDVIWTEQESWVLAKSAPGNSPFYDPEADEEMVGLLFTIFFNLISGVVTTTNLDELKFAVTNRILEHANTAA